VTLITPEGFEGTHDEPTTPEGFEGTHDEPTTPEGFEGNPRGFPSKGR
jgi:hypothetical protein